MAMTSAFETEDLDKAGDMLCRTYGRVRLSAPGDRHWMRLAQLDLGPVDLHHISFRMLLRVDVPPLGRIIVGRGLAGAAVHRIGGDGTTNGPGDLFMTGQPDQGLHSELDDHDGEYALFTPECFAQIAATAPTRAPRPIRFTGYRPVTAHAAETWHRSYDFVRDNFSGVSATAEPLLVGSAVRLLAAAALNAFPNTALHDPTISDRRDAHPASLRRAVSYIEENAHRNIAPGDVAAAAHVTVRTLQLAFRRHLDSTPMTYLRRVRLAHAHRHLLAADPTSTTVTAVARRWGFASHSRFSADYRAAYGVTPSFTLRSS